ncbi:hypothetical protein AI2903V1_3359 [Klebsiella pneumoniae]|nr:hypothetical protein AI2903V1_3359 [Klebsiella pneumoniae]CAH5903409.1 hypothetical protein AI2903V1_3359 [Klebsiella pneumoniae]
MTTDITELALIKGQKVEAPYYLAECTECGKMYSSSKLIVSRNYFDGDADCYCPHCNADDADIADLWSGEQPAVMAWNYQQARIDVLVEALEKAQTINAAAEKLVRCKGRYHSEQNYRALAALFGVTAPDLPPLDGDSCTVTIEPFRSFVTDADLAALHRFAECCDAPESGGHDLEKEQVRRLEAIGALQRSGRISYITGFGDVLISITAGIKWEAE